MEGAGVGPWGRGGAEVFSFVQVGSWQPQAAGAFSTPLTVKLKNSLCPPLPGPNAQGRGSARDDMG